MDFSLTAEQEALRQEICSFLEHELPPEPLEPQIVPEEETDAHFEFAVDFNKKLAERGWYTAWWPKEHGGLEFDPIEMRILDSELAYHGVGVLNAVGMQVASLLFAHGNEEQKQRFLPGIASCDVIWGEGYSEPDAGADLASLKTLALRDGDDYVVDGSKIWTGAGHRADWMFVFSRTNPDVPRHQGISFVLVDMQSPGVSVRPIENMAGIVNFAQEYFEGVRVPAENLVGEENTGWRQRPSVGTGGYGLTDNPSKMRRHLERLVEHYHNGAQEGEPHDRRALRRQKIGKLATEIELANIFSWRNASLRTRGEMTIAAGESAGIFNGELNQRFAGTAVEILGLYGPLLPENDRWVQLRGWFGRAYMFTVASTIYGGTKDVHRNVLAHRGLGLPRE